jgi:ribosomal protein S18 acetylase RimI-like enzyme
MTPRHPVEGDHRGLAGVVDHWFAGRRVGQLMSRSWFRHFGRTSWIADGERRRPEALLIGYLSQDRSSEAVIHLVGVDPNRRRRGVGSALVDAFVDDVHRRGATTVSAVAWPDDPVAIAFFRSLGFEPETGLGTQRLYGVSAFPDYDGPGEDRAVLRREIR